MAVWAYVVMPGDPYWEVMIWGAALVAFGWVMARVADGYAKDE